MVYGPSVYDVPLLPYERELIKTVGITEEEYRFFTAEVKRKGKLRPAEYAHIPDVQAGATGTAILINLAISLILTGVAYLLSPKPKMPSAKEGGTVNTGDVTGANRFTPSRGFETLATLADYAAPIPIIFGRYDSREKAGGMLTTPKLVWSRMFSEGTNQRAQLLFVVGEQGEANGIRQPELEGIFLGNNVLDSIFEDFYAFYWKGDSSDGNNRRVRATDMIYGTNGKPETGDPSTTTGEVFVCPVPGKEKEVAFCHAFSPANNTEFGVYDPIPNGTGYRLNYEIISIPEGQTGPAKKTQLLSRVKIAGDNNFIRKNPKVDMGSKEHLKKHGEGGQQGMGRNYSPRMGIIKLDRAEGGGSETTSESEMRKTISNIKKNDVISFKICRDQIQEDLYESGDRKESVSEINTTVRSAQFAADDAMRLGEQFQIGGCIWKVTSRSRPRFAPDEEDPKDQRIKLTCIDTDSSLTKAIGIVSPDLVLEPKDGYIGDTFEGSSDPQTIGEAFWPITKVSIGVVRNNRPAVTTEIGIKSTVFQNLKGLCAFSGLPSVDETGEYDEDNLQVKTGRITSYIIRTTVFRVFVRQVGSNDPDFNLIPLYFAIRGHRPVAQYTFIRFENVTLGQAELEFKFAQLSGSELRDLSKGAQVLDMSEPGTKDAKNSTTVQVNVNVVGAMNITVPGSFIFKSEITANKEFFRNPKSIAGSSSTPPSIEGDFEFAEQTQYTDISFYRDLVEKSNASQPEHQIVYVNEIQTYELEEPPAMNDLTLAGLSLKAGRNFSQLDQLRCWLALGIPVIRLHPSRLTAYEDNFAIGPSNLLTDLVYYLLTNQMGGAGGLLGMTVGDPFQVDKNDMIETSKFLYEQKLFFNGPITERTNLRQFVSDVAPFFLCNFVVTNGKFSLKPAFPVNSLGQFNEGAVPIAQLFTEGNILEDSYKLEYLGGEERRTFQAIVRYRQENPNRLPEEKAVTVKGTGGGYSNPRVELLPQEQFDLTAFCTSEHHAVMAAKYFLSLRNLVTHTISFSTTLDGLNIAAGSYIKVVTRSSPYSSTRNGTIDAAGAVTSLTDFADGQYTVSYFNAASEDVQEGVMTISNKTVSESAFANSVFSMIDDSVSQNVYVVEQLTFSQEGTVDIVASEHPCFSDGRSKLVDAIVNGSFIIDFKSSV